MVYSVVRKLNEGQGSLCALQPCREDLADFEGFSWHTIRQVVGRI